MGLVIYSYTNGKTKGGRNKKRRGKKEERALKEEQVTSKLGSRLELRM